MASWTDMNKSVALLPEYILDQLTSLIIADSVITFRHYCALHIYMDHCTLAYTCAPTLPL